MTEKNNKRRLWVGNNAVGLAIVVLLVFIVGWAAYSGILRFPSASVPSETPIPSEVPEEESTLVCIDDRLDKPLEVDRIVFLNLQAYACLESAEGEAILVPLYAQAEPAETPKPEEPTATPEAQEPTPSPEAVEPEGTVETGEEGVVGPVWSDPDAFDSRGTEYPFGDAEAWTYIQTWDGSDLDTVLHVAWAPGISIVVREYVGTRYQIWSGPDRIRWEEMRHECEERDELPKTPVLIYIESADDPDISDLPSNWSVEQLPG